VSGGIAPRIIDLCQLHSMFNLSRGKASWVHIGQLVNSKTDLYSGKKVKAIPVRRRGGP
jgi:hypothetical protein